MKVTLPSTLKNIYDYVFYLTKIHEIEIPKGVTYLVQTAFFDCKVLKTIKLSQQLQSTFKAPSTACKLVTY